MAMALEDVAMWLVHWLVGELAVARSLGVGCFARTHSTRLVRSKYWEKSELVRSAIRPFEANQRGWVIRSYLLLG